MSVHISINGHEITFKEALIGLGVLTLLTILGSPLARLFILFKEIV